MRKHAPVPDLLDAALKLPVRPAYEPPMASSFVKYNIFPETLDELMARLGEHGEAGAINVLWGAVTRWLLRSYGDDVLSNPYAVASLAVTLCCAHDRKRLGYPCYDSKRTTLVLGDLSEDNRQEALRVAAETIVDCQRAGSLIVTANDVKTTYQIITSITSHKAEALANQKDTVACPLSL